MLRTHFPYCKHRIFLDHLGFCLLLFVPRRVPNVPLAGKSFEPEANIEGGGAQLSVGKSTHVNYLLLVQQEMMKDNKLGKEKQQNKHFF